MTGITTPSYDPAYPSSIEHLIKTVTAMRDRCAVLGYWDMVPVYEKRIAFLVETERLARLAEGEAA